LLWAFRSFDEILCNENEAIDTIEKAFAIDKPFSGWCLLRRGLEADFGKKQGDCSINSDSSICEAFRQNKKVVWENPKRPFLVLCFTA